MTTSAPRESEALARAAGLRLEAGDAPGALQLFTESLQRDIGQAPVFFGAGLALEMMGDDAGAAASWRHALALDPALAEAHGALAASAARRRDWTEVRPAAEAALALRADQPTAHIAMALLELREGRPDAAGERMAVLLAAHSAEGLQRSQALRIWADALDRLGRADEAFERYALSARMFRTHYAGACAGPIPMAGLDLCQNLTRQYAMAQPALWRPAPGAASGPAAGHAFLIGFPRSGTTLLEQVLAGHPDVVALEERPTLAPAIDAYLDPPTGMSELTHMDAATADRLRAEYWTRVKAFGVQTQGKLFIDKQPFYGLWLPLIGKLFPQARIIVARRDPRDVVFSCFRNPFRMTPVTYELMDLERGAALYAGVMQSIELFLARADNPAFVYRHEDLVERFDDVVGDVRAFLGLDKHAQMTGFQEVAKARDIRTPSAHQVTQPLNRDGIGAWRRYGAHLAGVMPSLNALAQQYGYPSQ